MKSKQLKNNFYRPDEYVCIEFDHSINHYDLYSHFFLFTNLYLKNRMAICVCLCEFTCESNYRTYSYDNNGTVTSIQVLFLFD